MSVIQKVNTAEFYPTMKKWCKGNNFPCISPSMLPKNTFVIYGDGGTPLYSLCFYNTDSRLAWVGWELKNPATSKEERLGKLSQLFEHVEEYARGMGYDIVFTTSNTKPVEDVMLDLDYIVGDTNVNHYLKILN
jgi:hypothetical protein